MSSMEFLAGADPASKFRMGAISVIFGSQVSQRICCWNRDDLYYITLLWPNIGQ